MPHLLLLAQLLCFLCYATVVFGAGNQTIGEAERRYLSLLSMLSFESTINEVRGVVPEIAEVRDQGWGDAYASFPVRLFGIDMIANFSFHQSKLVSHGVSQRALKKATALRIYRSVRRQLVSSYGQTSEARGPGQDAHKNFARSSTWTANGKLLGVYWEKLYDGYQVGWGAQSAQ